jgi:hypothetical protein
MARLPNVPRHLDRGILLAASVAVRSPKLTPVEKRELRTLMKKHGGRGAARSGWSMADLGRCVWLVRKALRRRSRGGRSREAPTAPGRRACPTTSIRSTAWRSSPPSTSAASSPTPSSPGSFNAWYLHGVVRTARFSYRERFLLRRHGADVLQAFGL